MESQIPSERWSNRALFRLMWPLVVEQLLAVSIGTVDTVMVSSLGEAAVSGVSLVDSINILLLMMMASLATGGAVVASQYIGKRDRVSACSAARQLVYAVTALSLAIMVFVLVFRRGLLQLIYSTLDADVMENALSYLTISAISYPFIALYNAGNAIFRSMGNSRVGMATSFLINLLNIAGNSLLIYGLGMGVAGAALSTLISRAVAAVIVIKMLLDRHAGSITLAGLFRFHIAPQHIRQILKVGLPNGLENSLFQVGKLMVARMVTGFGTSAIAGNAIAFTVSTFATLPGQAFGLAMLTVVGQCVGAKNYQSARRNTRKLMMGAILCLLVLCMAILLLRTPILSFFSLSQEALAIGRECLFYFCLLAPVFWPFSFSLPNALRAAGDARYTMVVSMFSMWTFRIGLSWLLAVQMGFGVIGVWYSMIVDWVVRSAFFAIRWQRGRWESKRLI